MLIKKGDADNTIIATVEREDLWRIQTPQAFLASLLLEAHDSAEQKGIIATDDASLVEPFHRVSLLLGSERNFKVTYPEDLELCKILMSKVT